MRYTIAVSLAMLAAFAAAGCSDQPTTRPAERAMHDPMGYRPEFGDTNITGGGVTDFDKNAFRKDVDNVLNP